MMHWQHARVLQNLLPLVYWVFLRDHSVQHQALIDELCETSGCFVILHSCASWQVKALVHLHFVVMSYVDKVEASKL
jgi:hypothetical protein